MCAAIIKDEDKNLNLFRPIIIDNLDNYLLSEDGVIYNKSTRTFKLFTYNEKDKSYSITLNGGRYLLKYLLYLTFNPNNTNFKSKDLKIKVPSTKGKYYNFSISDIEMPNIFPDISEFRKIPNISELDTCLIHHSGIMYNTKTDNYLVPSYQKNTTLLYVVTIKKIQYQVKHLLYIAFVDQTIDYEELRNTKSKMMIKVNKRDDNLPYINFTIDDLEYISKSDNNKRQARNNRIINQYNSNKEFIKSHLDHNKLLEELGIKDKKPVRKACKDKNTLYQNYYFRYDDDDEIKNPEILNSFENLNIDEEEEKTNDEETIIYDKPEEWKRLQTDDDNNDYYKNYEISNYGKFRNFNTKKILKPHISAGYEYANINIYNPAKNKKEVQKVRINRLVAKYFISIPEKYLNEYTFDELVVDHIDEKKPHNYFKNLQYLTPSENVKKSKNAKKG